VFNGQTPGKRVLRLRVLTVEGHPIAGWQAILRNFLRAADALPMVPVPTYLVGLATATMNDRYQRLGDIAAGTMVVVERRRRDHGVARVDDPEAIALAAALPADLRIDRHLAQALSTYVERRGGLGAARRDEIAAHLARPFIARNALSPDLPPDALLAALYYRAFIADRPDETGPNIRDRNRPAIERSNFETALAAIGSDRAAND
jgi:hypothetical protein